MDFAHACALGQVVPSSSAAGGRVGNASPRRFTSLRNRSDIERVFREGRRSRRSGLTVLDLANGVGATRVAVVAGRKVGKAVERNRAKRRLREAAAIAPLAVGHDYILIADQTTSSTTITRLAGTLSDHIAEGDG